MSAKQDQRDMEKVRQALSPRQLANLEERAELHAFPKDAWVAIPGARMDALQWATTAVANELVVQHPEWSWDRARDVAEDSLLPEGRELLDLPRAVRTAYARWSKAVNDPG